MYINFYFHSVNPIYFVCFTTATIIASAILFQGFNTDNPTNVASLICGFVIIFTGVYLLDSIARGNSDTQRRMAELNSDGEGEEDEFLMGEAALLDEQQNGHTLSGLNQEESDEDIELVLRPSSRTGGR